jgi:hypothetical protein
MRRVSRELVPLCVSGLGLRAGGAWFIVLQLFSMTKFITTVSDRREGHLLAIESNLIPRISSHASN